MIWLPISVLLAVLGGRFLLEYHHDREVENEADRARRQREYAKLNHQQACALLEAQVVVQERIHGMIRETHRRAIEQSRGDEPWKRST